MYIHTHKKRLVVIESRGERDRQTDVARLSCRCLKQISLTTELNIIYEGYYCSHIDLKITFNVL